MIVCEDADSLAEQCIGLFANRQRCTQMGDAAHRIAEANRGALDRLLAVIDHRL
jgi:3-deoxy-D-manno-octulosonic-acid transferase